ncbi:MAG: tripartite tricarboxylate transporter substrate binding protein [Rubrivivax sp.]
MSPTHLSRRCLLQTMLIAATVPRARAAATEAPRTLEALQLVVPAPPGSQPDLVARWLIEPMARRIGVHGSVVNRPGAAGASAADAVLAAPPHSGALLLGGLDHVAYSHLNSQRRALDPFRDFLPVGAVNRDTWMVVVGAASPVQSMSMLVEQSRQGAGLNFASTGEGSTAHLISARLVKALGMQAQHVPYRDPWMPDLIAGRLHFVVAPTPAVIGQVRGGRLRALATLTDARLALFEGVPSISELGWPDQVFHGGLFLFAPAALGGHAERINDALLQALSQPDVQQHYRDAGIEITPLTLTQVAESVRQRLQAVDAMRLAVFGRSR